MAVGRERSRDPDLNELERKSGKAIHGTMAIRAELEEFKHKLGVAMGEHDTKLTRLASQRAGKEKALATLKGELYQERLSRSGGDGQTQTACMAIEADVKKIRTI